MKVKKDASRPDAYSPVGSRIEAFVTYNHAEEVSGAVFQPRNGRIVTSVRPIELQGSVAQGSFHRADPISFRVGKDCVLKA